MLRNKPSGSLQGCAVNKTYADEETFAQVSGGKMEEPLFPDWTGQGDRK